MNRITTRYEKESATGKVRKWVIALGLVIGQVLALTPQALAAEIIFNQRYSFAFPFFNDCTGETVLVSGEVHALVKRTVDRQGTETFDVQYNAHGEGIGDWSNNRYIWNDTFREEYVYTQGCSFTITPVDRYVRLISRGKLPNELLKQQISFGFDANCQFFFNSNFELKCVG
jgi:hypothetical protein